MDKNYQFRLCVQDVWTDKMGPLSNTQRGVRGLAWVIVRCCGRDGHTPECARLPCHSLGGGRSRAQQAENQRRLDPLFALDLG